MTDDQLPLVPGQPTPHRDSVYTPDRLAVACVERLHADGWLADDSWVVEPSVGGGAFARALRARGHRVLGVDRDPLAQGGRWCDLYLPTTWEDAVASGRLRDVHPGGVLGNPPFGGPDETPSYVGARHALLACQVAPVVALLLPAAWAVYRGVEEPSPADLWDDAGRPPRVVYPVRGRAFGDRLREVALFVWSRWAGTPSIGRPIEWR